LAAHGGFTLAQHASRQHATAATNTPTFYNTH